MHLGILSSVECRGYVRFGGGGGGGGGVAMSARGLIFSSWFIDCIVIANLIFSRGFLKGDKALGQVQLKLTPFDNKCEIHDCFDVSTCFVLALSMSF